MVVVEGADHVDEGLDGAHGVVSVAVERVGFAVHSPEHLIVEIASIQVLVETLDETSNEVDVASVGGHGARVERDLVLHLDRASLEGVRFDDIDL